MDSLRVRLMVLALLALLPLAGLVFYNAEAQRHKAARETEAEVLRVARICASHEEESVSTAAQMLAMLAEMPEVKKLDANACGLLLARSLGHEPDFENLGLLNASGNVVSSARPVSAQLLAAQRKAFDDAMKSGIFSVSDFVLAGDEPGAAMMCAEPVRAESGSAVGVVFAELNLQWLPELKAKLELPSAMTMGVLSGDGIIMMRVPDAAKYVGKSVKEAAAGRLIMQRRGSGTADEEGLDHVRRLFAFTPLDSAHGLGDFVSAGIPDGIAFSEARSSEQRQWLMLAVFAIVALTVAWLAADLLVLRGLRMLLKATQKVATGDLQTRAGPVFGGAEFRELARSFDAMTAALEKETREREAVARWLEQRVEQRTAELGEANRKLQGYIANVPAILFSIDRAGVITMAEGRGMEVLSFVEGGIVGRTVEELYGDVPGAVDSVKRALAGESFTTTVQLQQLFFEVAYSPIRAADGAVTGVIGVAHDITLRHHAEVALELSERRMRLIIENANDAYVAMDREGAIVDWNPQAERIFGWRREEALGRSLAETIIPQRLRERHLQGLVHYLDTGEGPVLNRRIEMPALHRGGREFPIELTISTMKIDKSVIFSAFIHDISERIHAKEELERTAGELRRSNEELEQFAYIASHDLQEPLRMVASYTQLIERRYADKLDDAAREFIAFAVDGARRMQEFITGLLRYSRVGTEPRVFENVSLNEVFETAMANLRVAAEESGAKIEARDLPEVPGDARQLTQLFQNLIGNALKFRKPGTAPQIEVWAVPDGDFWKVSVRDNGIGLDQKFADRVFVIFQRLHTRDEYDGTGLGLAICKKIVERHGGRIWVESKEGEGATFSFTLPARHVESKPPNESLQG